MNGADIAGEAGRQIVSALLIGFALGMVISCAIMVGLLMLL